MKGAPGLSTRRTSRKTTSGAVRYWIETAHIAPSKASSPKGSRGSPFTSCTMARVSCGFVGHLFRVQSESHHFAEAHVSGEMATPATHQIEQAPAGGEHLGVQAAESGDGPGVDVDDPAGEAVEAVVRRLVLARVGLGRRQAQRRCTSPVSMSITSRLGPIVRMASKPPSSNVSQ